MFVFTGCGTCRWWRHTELTPSTYFVPRPHLSPVTVNRTFHAFSGIFLGFFFLWLRVWVTNACSVRKRTAATRHKNCVPSGRLAGRRQSFTSQALSSMFGTSSWSSLCSSEICLVESWVLGWYLLPLIFFCWNCNPIRHLLIFTHPVPRMIVLLQKPLVKWKGIFLMLYKVCYSSAGVDSFFSVLNKCVFFLLADKQINGRPTV